MVRYLINIPHPAQRWNQRKSLGVEPNRITPLIYLMKDLPLGSLSLKPMRKFGDPSLPRRSILDGNALEFADPAVYAITDFKRDYPMTVDVERQIDDALGDMIRLGVRALLVAKEQRLVGLVTSYDIQGERPILFLQSSNYSRHEDIRVLHVMTPWDELMVIDWDQLEAAPGQGICWRCSSKAVSAIC